MVVCLAKMGLAYHLSVMHKKEQAALGDALRKAQASKAQTEDFGEYAPETAETSGPGETKEVISAQEPEILGQFEELYGKNSDLTGWLSIPGTKIDYPVMQSSDNEYYLHHNFYGAKDKYGCLFVKDFADVDTPGTNIVIYGHNMKDGSMFGTLDEYMSEAFYKEHRFVYFDTLYEKRVYEIMAVFLSQVYDSDDDVFKYYEFYQADTEDEFQYFYENVKSMALYDTGVTAGFGDTFITLSTCAYHVPDGRLAAVAKRIS